MLSERDRILMGNSLALGALLALALGWTWLTGATLVREARHVAHCIQVSGPECAAHYSEENRQ